MRTRSNTWCKTVGHGVVAVLAGAVMAFGASVIGTSPASAFGALAVSPDGPDGYGYNYPSESGARERALAECSKNGTNCQVVVVFDNTCAAFAGERGGYAYGWAYASTQEQAKNMAMGFCRKQGSTRCEVRSSACEGNNKRGKARDVVGDVYAGFGLAPPTQNATRVTPPPSTSSSSIDTNRASFGSAPAQQPSSSSSSGIDTNRASFGSPTTQQSSNTFNTPPSTTPRVDPLPQTPPPQSVAAVEPPRQPPPAQGPISGLLNDGTKRIALVVGNDRYESLPALQKAVNDSRSIGDTLTRLGFEVVRVENAQRRTMNQKLVEFTGKIGRGDTAFFFFAGHGVEIRGVNYLLPIDTPEARENEEGLITGEGIPADSILERLQERGAKVSLMVLDACRENPFKKQGSRGVGATRGLAQMTTPEGVFVLYSAGVGQTALDRLSDNDPNPNSVFTRAFVNVLSKPDQSIQSMAKVTQAEVRKLAATVNHPQMPAYYDQILGQFSLAPAAR